MLDDKYARQITRELGLIRQCLVKLVDQPEQSEGISEKEIKQYQEHVGDRVVIK